MIKRLLGNSKFRNKSVNLDKFVREIYVENGLAYISCNVKGYNDIIDRFSVKGYEWLNKSFSRFINENATYISPEYPIVLEICGHKFSKEQQETIEGTIADYYALKMGDIQSVYKKNGRKIAFLVISGIITALLFYLISLVKDFFQISPIISETILILFWLSIWELIDYAVFERNDLIVEKIKAAQLASMKISFKEKFDEEPIKPSEEQIIIKEALEDEELVPSDEW